MRVPTHYFFFNQTRAGLIVSAVFFNKIILMSSSMAPGYLSLKPAKRQHFVFGMRVHFPPTILTATVRQTRNFKAGCWGLIVWTLSPSPSHLKWENLCLGLEYVRSTRVALRRYHLWIVCVATAYWVPWFLSLVVEDAAAELWSFGQQHCWKRRDVWHGFGSS